MNTFASRNVDLLIHGNLPFHLLGVKLLPSFLAYHQPAVIYHSSLSHHLGQLLHIFLMKNNSQISQKRRYLHVYYDDYFCRRCHQHPLHLKFNAITFILECTLNVLMLETRQLFSMQLMDTLHTNKSHHVINNDFYSKCFICKVVSIVNIITAVLNSCLRSKTGYKCKNT